MEPRAACMPAVLSPEAHLSPGPEFLSFLFRTSTLEELQFTDFLLVYIVQTRHASQTIPTHRASHEGFHAGRTGAMGLSVSISDDI